jgi:hypothetical protein
VSRFERTAAPCARGARAALWPLRKRICAGGASYRAREGSHRSDRCRGGCGRPRSRHRRIGCRPRSSRCSGGRRGPGPERGVSASRPEASRVCGQPRSRRCAAKGITTRRRQRPGAGRGDRERGVWGVQEVPATGRRGRLPFECTTTTREFNCIRIAAGGGGGGPAPPPGPPPRARRPRPAGHGPLVDAGVDVIVVDTAHGHILLTDPATQSEGIDVLAGAQITASRYGLHHQVRSIEAVRCSVET